MKYVKTKDGRIIDCEDSKWKHPATYTEQAYIYVMSEKQADTIEELCDTGIVVNDTTKKVVSIAKEIKLDKYKWQKDTFTIYGAIWIKGEHNEPILKSVAKMNDKGKLELI